MVLMSVVLMSCIPQGIMSAEALTGQQKLATDSNGKAVIKTDSNGTEATGSNAALAPVQNAALASASNAEMQLFLYEDSKVIVSVLLPKETELPEGAGLQVEPVNQETAPERFRARCSAFRKKWSGDASRLEIYDIGFYTGAGEHVTVEAEAFVSFRFEEPLLADGGLAVLHFGTGEPEFLDIVDAETDGEQTVFEVTFRTNGFSDFGFAKGGVMPVTGGPGTGAYTMAGALILLCALLWYKYEGYKKGGQEPVDAKE